MSQSYIQNTKSNSIYNYIKKNNKDLYEVIKNTGTKNIFMKSNITFLMPTGKLLAQILESSPKDAIHLLKQLLLIDTINDLSTFTRNVYNIYELKLDNPSNLSLKMDPSWNSNKYCSVFLYDGETVPEASNITLSKQKTNKSNTTNFKLHRYKSVLDKYKKYIKNNKQGVNPFVMELAIILSLVKSNTEKYLEICQLMDNNAIVSWFIIMQIGLEDNPILSNDFFKLKTIEHPAPHHEYNEAFEYTNPSISGQNWFKNVSNIRKKLVNYFDISLPEQILNAYESDYMKLLQDEIRFKYRNVSDYYYMDIINELEIIDWNYPQNHIIFGNEELCKYLIQDEDKFYSGPVKFVKSIYFMYRPLNKKFYQQLIEKTQQSCNNPYENGIVYGDIGDRVFTEQTEVRRGYNVKSIWNAFSDLEKEQLKEFSNSTKLKNKEDIKQLYINLTDEQKDYIKELSA